MNTITAAFGLILIAFLCWSGTEAGVTECYYCDGTCKDPLQTMKCPNADTINYACWTTAASKDGVRVDVKSCLPKESGFETIEASCKEVEKEKGGHCRICDTDLCNSGEMYSLSIVLFSSLLLFKFL